MDPPGSLAPILGGIPSPSLSPGVSQSPPHPCPRPQATWNMSMLQTEDILKSVQAAMEKKGPEDIPFSKL